jgi:hypothetical protein
MRMVLCLVSWRKGQESQLLRITQTKRKKQGKCDLRGQKENLFPNIEDSHSKTGESQDAVTGGPGELVMPLWKDSTQTH